MGKTRRGNNGRSKRSITFSINGGNYKASGILAVVQRDEKTVEVRYGDGSNPLLLHDVSVSSVVAAIDRAKGLRR